MTKFFAVVFLALGFHLSAFAAIRSLEPVVRLNDNTTDKKSRRNEFFQKLGCPMEGFVQGSSSKEGARIKMFIRDHAIEVAGRRFDIEEPGLYEFFVPFDKKGMAPTDGKGVRMTHAPAAGEDPCAEYRDIEP